MQTSAHTADRVVLRDIPWETYLSLAEIEDRHTRIAYDLGVMEIMSPMHEHEHVGRLIGRMVETWTEMQSIDVVSSKSTTFKLDALSKGFEADESYYIQNAEQIWKLKQIDLSIHPAPDLVIEVDITNSSMRKFGIYSSLHVAEVWRWVDEQIHLYVLRGDGENAGYEEVSSSVVLPGFPVGEMVRLISIREEIRETPLIREFRAIAGDARS